MILLVPAILIALVVVLWIAWTPVGPRFGKQPRVQRMLAQTPTSETETQCNSIRDDETPSVLASTRESESEFEQHLQSRLESTHAPIGTMTGVQCPSSAIASIRDRNNNRPSNERVA